MGLGTVVFALLFVSVVAGALFYSYGRTLQAPTWVRTFAEEQFSAALPDAEVTFDNVTLHIQSNWHPRILLERMVIQPAHCCLLYPSDAADE